MCPMSSGEDGSGCRPTRQGQASGGEAPRRPNEGPEPANSRQPQLTLEEADERAGPPEGVICSLIKDFDTSLSEGVVAEKGFNEVFETGLFERVEVKADKKWPQTGNLAIEYKSRGQPSGIVTTKATCWVFPLNNGCYFVAPVEPLKELVRRAWAIPGRCVEGGDKWGEGLSSRIVLLRLCDILSCGSKIFP
jgi:hypothetical protein